MSIWHAPYALKARRPLNARCEERLRHGSLLKVRFATGMTGYADCLPWPELGDAPLPAQLNSLRGSAPHPAPLAARSLALACNDAVARAQGVSLLDGAQRLRNHHLISQPSKVDQAYAQNLRDEGFTRAKLKIGIDSEQERRAMHHLAEAGLKLRPDFNRAQHSEAIDQWCKAHRPLLAHCDFLEDPLPLGPAWQALHGRHPVPLALDGAPLGQYRPEASVRVLKPAWHSPTGLQASHKLVVTHAMDHPIGQAHAVACAIQLQQALGDRLLDCGLLGHAVYEQDAKIPPPLPSDGPQLKPAGDLGIGYSDFLAAQEWIPL